MYDDDGDVLSTLKILSTSSKTFVKDFSFEFQQKRENYMKENTTE